MLVLVWRVWARYLHIRRYRALKDDYEAHSHHMGDQPYPHPPMAVVEHDFAASAKASRARRVA
jgi:hypothetical protein